MPSLLTKVKTIILEILNIYMEKYGEEFGPFVDEFAKNIWGMLTQTGLELKYDAVSSIKKQRIFLIFLIYLKVGFKINVIFDNYIKK